MKNFLQKASLPIMALLTLTGCVDDNYDLSDIDTTSRIKVNDLQVPVKLGEITLDQVLDVDEDDEDAIITKFMAQDGKTYYAIKKGGDFNSDPVFIDKVYAPSAKINQPTVKRIDVPSNFNLVTTSLKVPYTDDALFDYTIDNVDMAIRSLYGCKLSPSENLELSISFSSEALAAANASWSITNLQIKLPEGFHGSYGSYEIGADGMITIPSTEDTGITKNLVITINELNLLETYPEQGGLVNNDGEININGQLILVGADLKINGINGKMPSVVDLAINFSMGAFTVEYLSGNVNYEVEAPSIAPVELSDLPDFLKGEGTEIKLFNPQLYLSVNNVPGDYGVEATSGLTIQPYHDNNAEVEPIQTSFTIGQNSSDGFYNLLMAPDPQQPSLTDYTNLNTVEVPELRRILYGDGLPTSIDFNLDDPVIEGNVMDFPLGQNLEFNGRYTFFTPLQFEAGSVIHYVKDEKDWFDGDVDKMHIENFELKALATTTLPFSLTLTAYPYVKEGDKQYLDYSNKATATIEAGANQQPILLNFEKEIDGLNGVYFDAEIYMENEEALSPSQTVELEDIKAVVNGYYDTKF